MKNNHLSIIYKITLLHDLKICKCDCNSSSCNTKNQIIDSQYSYNDDEVIGKV